MKRMKRSSCERGVVLVIALLLMAASAIAGIAAVTSSSLEVMISGNQKSLQQVFDAAEAGIEVGINAFFVDAPPGGVVRPPIADRPRGPWGIAANEKLKNGCEYSVWVTDMQVCTRPRPGYDPNHYRTFYYRIRSIGKEGADGLDEPRGVKEVDQVVGVLYRVK